MTARELSKEEKVKLISDLTEHMLNFAACKLEGISRAEFINIFTASLYAALYRCTCKSAKDIDSLFMALSNEVTRGYIAIR